MALPTTSMIEVLTIHQSYVLLCITAWSRACAVASGCKSAVSPMARAQNGAAANAMDGGPEASTSDQTAWGWKAARTSKALHFKMQALFSERQEKLLLQRLDVNLGALVMPL